MAPIELVSIVFALLSLWQHLGLLRQHPDTVQTPQTPQTTSRQTVVEAKAVAEQHSTILTFLTCFETINLWQHAEYLRQRPDIPPDNTQTSPQTTSRHTPRQQVYWTALSEGAGGWRGVAARSLELKLHYILCFSPIRKVIYYRVLGKDRITVRTGFLR